MTLRDEAAAGEHYKRRVDAAARDPYSVGLMWFQYRDQSLTGRGPGQRLRLVFGENHSFGAITETDLPKTELVKRMREGNLAAAATRLGAGGE